MRQRQMSPLYLASSRQNESSDEYNSMDFSLGREYGSPTIMCKSDKMGRFYTRYDTDFSLIFLCIMCVKAGFQLKLFFVS